jgi:hypothetical protein
MSRNTGWETLLWRVIRVFVQKVWSSVFVRFSKARTGLPSVERIIDVTALKACIQVYYVWLVLGQVSFIVL